MRGALLAAVAGTVSVGVHLVGFGLVSLPSPPSSSGGGAPLAVALASPAESFADLGADRLIPVQPKTIRSVEAVPLDPARTASYKQRISPVRPASNVQNSTAALLDPVSKPDASRALGPQEAEPLAVAPARPQRLVAQAPVRLGVAGPGTVRPKSRPTPKSNVREPAQQTKSAPQKTARAPAFARKPEPAPKAAPAKTAAVPTVASPKPSQSAGARGAPSAFRNAVIRKISRTRKERAGARGQALVRFRVTDSGAVADLRVVRSSGSQAVDRVALRHVRRAGPFPPPPEGAQRRFDVVFKSPG